MTSINNQGYIYLTGNKGKPVHIVLAEKALGRRLPKKAEVHHVDNDVTNNAPNNLVICPDRSYHYLLHTRTEALDTCGDANKRRCQFCQKYDSVINLVQNKNSGYRHKACQNEYNRRRRRVSNSNR